MHSRDKLKITFDVQTWRYIGSACAAVKATSLIDGERIKPILRNVSLIIAKETGK